MGSIINLLVEYYVVVIFIAILLILALIGYIVDSSKTNKIKKELSKEPAETLNDIPVATPGVKLGETVNNMTMNSSANVNANAATTPVNTKEETPTLGVPNK